MTENTVTGQQLNWHPEIVKAGPVARFCLDSLTGELRHIPSDEPATTCNHDLARTSGNESTSKQAS
jgi:hypothetical protein